MPGSTPSGAGVDAQRHRAVARFARAVDTFPILEKGARHLALEGAVTENATRCSRRLASCTCTTTLRHAVSGAKLRVTSALCSLVASLRGSVKPTWLWRISSQKARWIADGEILHPQASLAAKTASTACRY